MAQFSKELILAQGREFGGSAPTPERAEELAGILNTLAEALDKAAAGVAFEAEPADMQTALDQLAGD